MTDQMTEQEYWTEVQSIADTIAEDSLESTDTREDAGEWVHDRLHETIDGHEWIVYTHRNHEVLLHSPNDGYTIENFGSEGIVTDGVLNWALLAYGALYADVQEKLGDAVDEVWDAREEEEAKE